MTNRKRKPKTNQKGDPTKSAKYDRCQTPGYALDPLLPYIGADVAIWEPAAGQGQIVRKLESEGRYVSAHTDLLRGENFFEYQPLHWEMIITNPPYSIKYKWLKRCYELGKPFALLMPTETLAAAKAIKLFWRYGMEIIQPNRRINFKMPDKGYSGKGAQFSTAWFTWGLGIGQPITYVPLTRYADEQANFLDLAPVITRVEGVAQLSLI